MRAALTALLVALTLALPRAQPSFRAGVELVTVPVTVQPRDAHTAVPPLTTSDFRVYEDGEEQRLTVAEIDRRPAESYFSACATFRSVPIDSIVQVERSPSLK